MNYFGLTLFMLLSIGIPFNGFSQDSDTASASQEIQKFLTLVNANREQSYITFGSGLGNLEPLIFEGRLSPSYFFTGKQRKWALVVNPQVGIRMLDRKSFPIRNPSYKAYVTFYREIEFWKRSFLHKIFYNNAVFFASIAHHSNGQDGSFYNPDSTRIPNLENGNFSTNFIEFGLSAYKLSELGKNYFSIREAKAWVEFHPPRWSIAELDDRYGYYRIYGKVGIVGPMRKRKNDAVNRWLQRSSIEIKSGWIFGEMNGASPFDPRKRIVVDLTYKYYPVWLDEIAFFLRFYQGQDYYNIYFIDKTLTQISIGITSNIMSFKNATMYLK
ncbi:hypothetical protein DQQ10_09845 [Pseudochryseolinea flava]|uniref:Phosphatidylcholine 1-acylhydrolase n=2 Tax=Pseudochryseolinea flava TaxID=2059302 RepID=A0A364Y5U6_9BACT|nr:hypothetical protein DQQ10_09845 [Pseudochryseolinea flava]